MPYLADALASHIQALEKTIGIFSFLFSRKVHYVKSRFSHYQFFHWVDLHFVIPRKDLIPNLIFSILSEAFFRALNQPIGTHARVPGAEVDPISF